MALLLAALLLAGSASTPRHAPALTARSVLDRITASGPEPVMEELYASDARWGQVVAGIATGDPQWLTVAEKLKPVGGNGTEQLTTAVAEALARQPARVLAILGRVFDADNVCSLNTLEESLGPSYADALRKVAARKKAVAAVADPALSGAKDDCLGFLDELSREVDRNHAAWYPKP